MLLINPIPLCSVSTNPIAVACCIGEALTIPCLKHLLVTFLFILLLMVVVVVVVMVVLTMVVVVMVMVVMAVG
jgi:hypothetical protein